MASCLRRWTGVVFALAAGMAFACGGNAFTAGGGPTTLDGSTDTSSESDSAPRDAPLDAVGDGSAPADGPATTDSPSGPDAVGPAPDGGLDAGVSISGNVVDQFLVPMPGVVVHVQGQMATTASDGTFSLPGIVTPYLATVVSTVGGHRHGYVFTSLTRKDPTLQLTAETAAMPQSTTVTGHLGENGNGVSGIVFADFGPTTPVATSNTIGIASGAMSYSGPLSWFGPPAIPATLYTLGWVLASGGGPGGYIAFTSQAETVSAGATLTWNTPTQVSPLQAQLQVMLGLTPGYVPADISLYIRPQGAQIAAPIQHVTSGFSVFSGFTTPQVNATFVACGVQEPAGTDAGPSPPYGAICIPGLAPDATTTLTPPPATLLEAPPATATLGTPFNYAALNDGVYLVAFAPAGGSTVTGDSLYVVTDVNQVKVPDLSPLGFDLPSGATYAVEVYGFAPFATLDTAVSPTGFSTMALDLRLDQGPQVAGQLTHSGVATFTVQ